MKLIGVFMWGCLLQVISGADTNNPYHPFVTPNAPKLHVVEVSHKSITIGWDFQTNAVGYTVCYRRMDESGFSCVDFLHEKTLTFELHNLSPSTAYFFSVSARSWTTPSSPLSPEMKVTTTAAPPATAEVMFLERKDNMAEDWFEHFGSDGYSIAAGSRWFSPGVSVGQDNSTDIPHFTWMLPANEHRALLQSFGRTNRVAATFSVYLTKPLNVSSDVSRNFTIYALDWDRGSRQLQIEFYDVFSDRLLDSRIVSEFEDGAYLTYALKGSIRLVLTTVGFGRAHVASGFFFGGPLRNAKPNLSIQAMGRGLNLSLSGPTGRSFVVESSGDMHAWVTRSTGILDLPNVLLTIDPAEGIQHKFFRASLK